jgi:hypothetical protein
MAEQVDVYIATYLGMAAGRQHGDPVLILTMRPESRSFRPCNFRFSRAQARRIHDDLGRLLSDPESWLHVAKEQRQRTEGE